MTERVDFKLRHVVVATFRYRHEAELAAGFLADAGIPYRLQIDDPAMGMTITTPPTLWVRGIDLRAAREVLHLDGGEASPEPEGAATPLPADGEPVSLEVVRGAPPVTPLPGRLTPRERFLAILAGGGAGAVAAMLPASSWAPLLSFVLWMTAGVMGLSALVGRTAPPIARLLRTLAGSAP